MLTKVIQIFLQQKTGLFRTARNCDMQPGEPHANLLKQTRGSSFLERKRKLGRAITNKEFHLLYFVMDVRHESFPFWPPYFILNEVSVYYFFYSYQLIFMHVSTLYSLLKREGGRERFIGDPPYTITIEKVENEKRMEKDIPNKF